MLPGQVFSPGAGPETLDIPGLPPVGPLICYETAFSGQITNPQNRPAWLLAISDNAWFGGTTGPAPYFATTRLRAVEEGLPLFLDTNSGITAVIGPRGQVLGRLPTKRTGILVRSLPRALPPTEYARFGLTTAGILSLYAVVIGLCLLIVSAPFWPTPEGRDSGTSTDSEEHAT